MNLIIYKLKKKLLYIIIIVFIFLLFRLFLKKKVFRSLIKKLKKPSKNPHSQMKKEIKVHLTSKIMIPGQCYCMNEKYNIFKNNNYIFKIKQKIQKQNIQKQTNFK